MINKIESALLISLMIMGIIVSFMAFTYLGYVMIFGISNDTIEVEKDFEDYDYMLGEVTSRSYNFTDKDYSYTIELEDGQTGEVYSDKLFSIGEKVLIIEYEEGKVILIDLD